MELRTSDLQNINSKNQIQTGIAKISFNADNIYDLLLARDLTPNAQFEISNVSTDKRALRETETFYANEVDFETPFELRLFTIQDTIQVKIKDINEVYVGFKVAELPLSIDR